MKTHCKLKSGQWLVAHGFAVALLTALITPASQAQNDICIPDVGSLAGTPLIDGVVEGYTGAGGPSFDAGWNGATRVNLSADLGATTAAKFQAKRDTGFVYLSFSVSTPTASPDDTVVLAFSTDADPAHDWRIHIQPFPNALPDGKDQVPESMTYWRDSSTWNNSGVLSTTAAPSFWLKDNTRFSKSGIVWELEMKIPIILPADAGLDTGIYFPGTGTFSMYVNVLSTSVLLGTYSQDPWPATSTILGPGFLTQLTPSKPLWGTVSFNDRPQCAGVTLSWADIGVESPTAPPTIPPTIIQEIRRYDPPGPGTFTETSPVCDGLADNYLWPTKGPPNIFVARPKNEMPGNAKVSAAFRLAHWGIPGLNEWEYLGGAPNALGISPSNPTAETIIAPGNFGNLTTTWEVSYKWSCRFFHHPHQCMEVDLDSTDPGTIFKNKSVQKNMDFVPASVFTRTAFISGNQGPLPRGKELNEFVILVETDETRSVKGPASDQAGYLGLRSKELNKLAAIHFRKTNDNLAVWIARGFRREGNKLKINNHEYEYMKRVGDFGVVAGHQGAMTAWKFQLTGAGLKNPKAGLYTLDVPRGQVAVLQTRIEAVEVGGGSKKGCMTTRAGTNTAGMSGLVFLGLLLAVKRRKQERGAR